MRVLGLIILVSIQLLWLVSSNSFGAEAGALDSHSDKLGSSRFARIDVSLRPSPLRPSIASRDTKAVRRWIMRKLIPSYGCSGSNFVCRTLESEARGLDYEGVRKLDISNSKDNLLLDQFLDASAGQALMNALFDGDYKLPTEKPKKPASVRPSMHPTGSTKRPFVTPFPPGPDGVMPYEKRADRESTEAPTEAPKDEAKLKRKSKGGSTKGPAAAKKVKAAKSDDAAAAKSGKSRAVEEADGDSRGDIHGNKFMNFG